MKQIGTVVSTFEGPTPGQFSFVLNLEEAVPVRKDQFVTVESADGQLIARVVNIRKTNKYFGHPESVKEYEGGGGLNSLFPVDEWQYVVADALALGVWNSGVKRSTFPVSPGAKVSIVDTEILRQFLGFEPTGLYLGEVDHHKLPVKIRLERMLKKHVAILAMSGAGKSYLTAVLIEELLERKKEDGRLAVVVFDMHGEYSSLGKGKYQNKVAVVEGEAVKIPVSELSAYQLKELTPGMSSAAMRELSKVLRDIRTANKGSTYDIDDIVSSIESDKEIKDSIKGPLVGTLEELKHMRLFGPSGYPSLKAVVRSGEAIIFDLTSINNYKAKQIVVGYITGKLFEMRKRGEIPPYVQVVEEAHNFVPEGAEEKAMARRPIELVAREGRKFGSCLVLISQRPKRLSTTVLSQCNTNIILRITNPYDLDHLGQSSEGITRETLDSITSLQVGDALVVGEAVNYPVFFRVRRRNTTEGKHARSLEEVAKEFEEKSKDAEEFL